MHVAIDDTYGPETASASRYVTGARRTYVAVEFPDHIVGPVCDEVYFLHEAARREISPSLTEFHFTDIYNRRGLWASAAPGANLAAFERFAELYRAYKCKLHLQTVDDRTLSDLKGIPTPVIDDLDLTKRDDLALMLLLLKVKRSVPHPPERLSILVDEGRGKPGNLFAPSVFREWGALYDGRYCSSSASPLIQLADFLAFTINRTTNLQMKSNRSDTDLWFLRLVGDMDLKSADLTKRLLPPDFTIEDFDTMHADDRRQKGIID